MEFEAKNIPWANFESVGKSKKEILGLPPDDLKALLSGRTTSLQEITNGQGEKVKAKLSLYPENDGSLGIRIHPVREKIDLPPSLGKKEEEMLKEGKNVVAIDTSKNGIKEPYMFKLDPETNEVLKTRVDNIRIPKILEGVEITPIQKIDLLKGKEIELIRTDGTINKIMIDINSPTGYKSNPVDQEVEVTKKRSKDLGEKNNGDEVILGEGKGRSMKEELSSTIKAGLLLGPLGIVLDQATKNIRRDLNEEFERPRGAKKEPEKSDDTDRQKNKEQEKPKSKDSVDNENGTKKTQGEGKGEEKRSAETSGLGESKVEAKQDIKTKEEYKEDGKGKAIKEEIVSTIKSSLTGVSGIVVDQATKNVKEEVDRPYTPKR